MIIGMPKILVAFYEKERERLRSIMFGVGGSFKETSCCFQKSSGIYKRMKNRMRVKTWNKFCTLVKDFDIFRWADCQRMHMSSLAATETL